MSFAAGSDGALLTVWHSCTEGELTLCHAAWLLQTSSASHRGLVAGDSPSAHSAGDAFVVKAWNRAGIVVTADGGVRPVVDSEPAAATSDSALVYARGGPRVVDARTATTWPLQGPHGAERLSSAVIAPDGTVWASTAVDGEVRVAWMSDGTWQHHVMTADQLHDALPAYVAVAGDHVASVSGYDGATILHVADLAVTTDHGRTWTDLHQSDLPFKYVDAMAATSDGTLYVIASDAHGGTSLFRTTDTSWSRFQELPNPHDFQVLTPAGNGVLAQGGTYDDPALFMLDDAGRSTAVPLAR